MRMYRVVLTLIPFIWAVCMVPFVNKTHPIIMGLPFLAFWEICSIFVAFLCLGILYTKDKNYKKQQ